jgi:hypothetical protein
MGLRCLLGHDFDDIEVEREREEEGDEMVVTVREVKTCGRCDHRQVVSENKEVTSIRPPAEATAEAVTAGVEGETEAGGPVRASADAAGTEPADAEFVDGPSDADDAPAADRTGAAAGATAGTEAARETDDVEAGSGAAFNDDEFEPPTNPEEDDGVILDDGDGETPPGDRGHGEWPDSDDTHEGAAAGAWPDREGEDEGFDAESPDNETAEVEFGGGLAPQTEADGELSESVGDGSVAAEDDAEEGYDAEFVGGPDTDTPDEGFVRATAAEVGGGDNDVATEYHCPSCGMSRVASGSSMRAGDICPECKTGYVTERER